MSTSAQFSEKVYEEHLKYELMTRPGRLWSPDTVLERQLGIDGVLEAKVALWTLLGRPPVPGLTGAYIAGFLPTGVDDQGLSGVGFQANLLLQVKRSRWFQNRNSTAKNRGWTPPYWCFEVTPHQQATLALLAAHCGASALVTYASPAFHSTGDLLMHAGAGTLVPNTTWPDPAAVNGHQRWLYANGGSAGVPNPEYRFVELVPLADRIEAAFSEVPRGGNDAALSNVWERLRGLLDHKTDMFPWGPRFVSRADELIENSDRHDAAMFAGVYAAFDLLDVIWLVIGGRRES